MQQPCACTCGASKFAVDGKPIGRFLCHCSICQSLYKQPYADVTVFWAGSIKQTEPSDLVFKRYRLPPAVRRGTCPACGAPVLGYLRLAPFVQLGFVASRNFSDAAALPAPSTHIFYHRRVADVADALPKVSGYWPSEIAVIRLVLAGL